MNDASALCRKTPIVDKDVQHRYATSALSYRPTVRKLVLISSGDFDPCLSGFQISRNGFLLNWVLRSSLQ
jgi:hypothetical protein